MATELATPVDMTAAEDAIHGWIESATGVSAYWARSNAPRPALPLILLDIVTPPAILPTALRADEKLEEKQWKTRIVVTATGAGTYTLGLDAALGGASYPYTEQVGDDVDDIAAGLSGLVNAGAQPVTATPVGSGGALDVEADNVGDPYAATVSASMTATTTQEAVDVHLEAPYAYTLGVDVFADAAQSKGSSIEILSRIQAGLETQQARAELAAGGVAYNQILTVLDVSDFSGTGYEERAHLDALIYIRSRLTEQETIIETANVSPAP